MTTAAQTTAQNRLLLGTDHVGSTNKLRCASEFCARSGRGDLSDSFATMNERSGESLDPRSGFDRRRLSRKHRLVEQHLPCRNPHIRRDHAAKR